MFERAANYLHGLEGRLRIKLPGIKRSPSRATQTEQELRGWEGIEEVEANPLTGSVLILYDPQRLKAHELIGTLLVRGYFQDPYSVAARMLPANCKDDLGGFLRSIGLSLIKLGLKRLIFALV